METDVVSPTTSDWVEAQSFDGCDGPTADRPPTLTHEAQGCWSPGMEVSARGRVEKSEGNVPTLMATGFCGLFSKGVCCETQRMHQGTEKPPERVYRVNCVPPQKDVEVLIPRTKNATLFGNRALQMPLVDMKSNQA